MAQATTCFCALLIHKLFTSNCPPNSNSIMIAKCQRNPVRSCAQGRANSLFGSETPCQAADLAATLPHLVWCKHTAEEALTMFFEHLAHTPNFDNINAYGNIDALGRMQRRR